MNINSASNDVALISSDKHPFESDPLLSDRETSRFLGCGRSTVWRWAAEGVIPKPLKLGGMSRWRLSELNLTVAKADAAREAV